MRRRSVALFCLVGSWACHAGDGKDSDSDGLESASTSDASDTSSASSDSSEKTDETGTTSAECPPSPEYEDAEVWSDQSIELPGNIGAIQLDDTDIVVCGPGHTSPGYFAQIRIDEDPESGELRPILGALIDTQFVCSGLVVGDLGWVVVTDALEAALIRRDLPLVTAAQTAIVAPLTSGTKDGLRSGIPRRGVLLGDELFVAAGTYGTIRSRWSVDRFIPHPEEEFVTPDSRDVLAWGEDWLLVADWSRGVVAFDRESGEELGAWSDVDVEGPTMATRLRGRGSRVVVAREVRGTTTLDVGELGGQPVFQKNATIASEGAPVIDVRRRGLELLNLTPSRLTRYDLTAGQVLEIGSEEIPIASPVRDWFRGLVDYSETAVVVGVGNRVEVLQLRPFSAVPEIRPLVNSGFAYPGVHAELHFSTGPGEDLWIEEPEFEFGARFRLDLTGLRPASPGCVGKYWIEEKSRFVVRAAVDESVTESFTDTLIIRSNDPSQPELRFRLVGNPPTAIQKLGSEFPQFVLPGLLGGIYSSADSLGRYLLVEYIGPGTISDPASVEEIANRLKVFDPGFELEFNAEVRNLDIVVVYSGFASPDDLTNLVEAYTIAGRPQIPILLDPYFETISEFSRREDGSRLYPFRVLVDRSGQISQIDSGEVLSLMRNTIKQRLDAEAMRTPSIR